MEKSKIWIIVAVVVVLLLALVWYNYSSTTGQAIEPRLRQDVDREPKEELVSSSVKVITIPTLPELTDA